MSILTNWFNLFKYQADDEGMQTFNIDLALNNNWDKVDEALHGLDDGKEPLVKNAAKKDAPIDTDSVVLIDSKADSKTKRLTWANIKAALGKVFAAIKHTHPIADIVELAEEIAAIWAALSDKAAISDHNLRTYTLLAQLGLSGAVTMEQVCSALPDGAELCFLHREDRADRISDAPFNFGTIIINRGDPNNVSCKAFASTTANAYIGVFRVLDNPRFSGWVLQATATPPTEYALPLAAGVTAHSPCRYWRNQEHEVHTLLTFYAQGAMATDGIIATYPAGYRPSERIEAIIYTNLGAFATLVINPADGTIRVGNGTIGAGAVCFVTVPSFLAA